MNIKRILLSVLGLILLFGSWWTYQLIWGRPLNINHFYERVLIEYLLDDPELLTQTGIVDNTILDLHSDELTDASPSRDLRLLAKSRNNLNILLSYDRADQTKAQLLSTDILAWFLDDVVRGAEFIYHDYPLNPLYGVQIQLPGFMDATHQVVDEHSAKNYIARLSRFGTKFDQVSQGLRLREAKGIIPPKFIIERTVMQMRKFTAQPAEHNILFTSFKRKLEKVKKLNAENKATLYAQVHTTIDDIVYSAYERLINYLETLKPKASSHAGVWKLPNGERYYAYLLRSHTTTELGPEEVHQLGLSEVARIQAEMRAILDGLGYRSKTVAQHMRQLAVEPRFLYPDSDAGRTQILTDYRAIINEIDTGLAHVFDLRPNYGVEVKRLPQFKEQTAPTAHYSAPALDGSRPGVFLR